ncbi:hypothetical protein HY604_05335 [Candidatus Peregrinibacteria bacterium]|nr:hypothetical protein [Candidatus Peregrinibacteria bacterium]
MKKLLLSFLTLVLFTGCTFGDMFVDRKGAHNGLIVWLNGIFDAEEKFFNEYYALTDGADTAVFLKAYDDFETAVKGLDTYMNETEFGSTQGFYVIDYKADYKPFIDDYVSFANGFAAKVEKDGFSYAALEPYFADLDQYTVDFVDVHDAYAAKVDKNAGNY